MGLSSLAMMGKFFSSRPCKNLFSLVCSSAAEEPSQANESIAPKCICSLSNQHGWLHRLLDRLAAIGTDYLDRPELNASTLA
uniref:Uncharacterized protein n=1 Tax=Picea glauca TaxID=3330 RepID=A0A101M0B6_PICGL|nr:hypothetical protein ABT39_MTgene4609 [Picea glauca]QHR92505.1 hypothetical protein Q903MT_gene6551 [Picea sitchensis]